VRKLSIIMPVLNEARTLRLSLDRAYEAPLAGGLERELIIVDGESSDGSAEIARAFAAEKAGVSFLSCPRPGKGSAVREGLAHATGDIVLIQDADLEYEVSDYPALLEPILGGKTKLVLGSRYLAAGSWKIRHFESRFFLSLLFNLGGLFFHGLFNLLYGVRLTDPTTMYKVFRRDAVAGLVFHARRFDFDYELLGKLIRSGAVPLEVPVAYRARHFGEGKKIRVFRDPWTWLWAIFRYRLSPLAQEESALASACASVLGVASLVGTGLVAFGGPSRLWAYSRYHTHKFVAARLLEGHWSLSSNLRDGVRGDLQVFNGAAFTNWGYGVPLLQLPFHWAAKKWTGDPLAFFPDRVVFFLCLAAATGFLWYALHALTGRRLAPLVLSFFVLTFSLYGLISYRFIVYEETIAYFVLFELAALSAYLLYVKRGEARWVTVAAVTAGMALLIRPTGLFYLATWLAVLALSRRQWRAAARFVVVASPFVAFWMATNWIRSGHLFSPGLENALNYNAFEFQATRFGLSCSSGLGGAAETARGLFHLLFVGMPELSGHLARCRYIFEPTLTLGAPVLGALTGPALLAALALFAVRCRERLEVFVPYVTLGLLFAAFVYAGVGFCARYAGDFWPLVLLVFFHAFLYGPKLEPRALLAVIAALSLWRFARDVPLQRETIRMLPAAGQEVVAERYALETKDSGATFPEHVACGDAPTGTFADRLGWREGCSVDTFTHLFLGVPRKSDSTYHLELELEGALPRELKVNVNGRIYIARGDGKRYRADFPLRYEELYSPNVDVTIQWTTSGTPPPVRLLRVGVS
jgi:hypothetical protein